MKSLNIILFIHEVKSIQKIIDFLSKDHKITLANSLKKAHLFLASSEFDLAIIDTNGKLDRTEFAKYILSINNSIPFIFLPYIQSRSIYEQTKLTMPFNIKEIQCTIELAIENKQEDILKIDGDNVVLSPEYLFVKKKNRVEKLEVSSINYIKVEEKYCNLVCNNDNFFIKLSLIKLKEILSNSDFNQVHRNYLVNIKKIKEIYFEESNIILDNDRKIPFTKKYKSLFLKNNSVFR